MYDLEGQWINVWVPRIAFVPASIEEVRNLCMQIFFSLYMESLHFCLAVFLKYNYVCDIKLESYIQSTPLNSGKNV